MEVTAKAGFRTEIAKAGFSLRGIATKAGIARESVCRMANGRPVRPATAKKLCSAAGVAFDDLFQICEERGADHVRETSLQ